MGTIVITGGASGIGAAAVARLASRGHRLITVDVRDADIIADLGTSEGRADAISGVLERSDGVLDGLVPCAGLGPIPGRAGSRIVAVNYFGTVALLEGLRPALARSSAPAAVAISSNSVTHHTPALPVDLAALCLVGNEPAAPARADEVGPIEGSYPASKLAVARWVRRHAVTTEWIGAGIRLNAVAARHDRDGDDRRRASRRD